MKKVISLIAFLCIILTLTGCKKKLPDPAIVVENYFVGFSENNEKVAAGIMEREGLEEVIAEYPELEGIFHDYVMAYIGSLEYEIRSEETILDPETLTAEVFVTLKYADFSAIYAHSMGILMDWFWEVDYIPEDDEMFRKLCELYIEDIESGDFEKETEDVVVKLVYNSEIKNWVINNEEEMLEGFLG